jgi:hypothetical protein
MGAAVTFFFVGALPDIKFWKLQKGTLVFIKHSNLQNAALCCCNKYVFNFKGQVVS